MAAWNTLKRKMDITVKNLQKKIPLRPDQIKTVLTNILKHLRIPTASLTVIFISRQKIQALNKQYLHRSYATDVLAFDLSSQKKKNVISGDIFISTDAVLQNARVFKNNSKQELVLYMVHGILHLLGYDDHSPSDIKKIRAKEREVMEFLERIGKS